MHGCNMCLPYRSQDLLKKRESYRNCKVRDRISSAVLVLQYMVYTWSWQKEIQYVLCKSVASVRVQILSYNLAIQQHLGKLKPNHAACGTSSCENRGGHISAPRLGRL